MSALRPSVPSVLMAGVVKSLTLSNCTPPAIGIGWGRYTAFGSSTFGRLFAIAPSGRTAFVGAMMLNGNPERNAAISLAPQPPSSASSTRPNLPLSLPAHPGDGSDQYENTIKLWR